MPAKRRSTRAELAVPGRKHEDSSSASSVGCRRAERRKKSPDRPSARTKHPRACFANSVRDLDVPKQTQPMPKWRAPNNRNLGKDALTNQGGLTRGCARSSATYRS